MLNNYNPDVLSCLANLSNDEVFTSPDLANKMLDLLPSKIWKDKNAKFLDPVSKTGVFLREITKRLIAGLEEEIPDIQERINHILKNQVYGIAITELTALLSRRTLYCSKTANGNYSICSDFKNAQGNIIFDHIYHKWENGRCKYCGASRKEYERSSSLETHAYQFIHTKKPEDIFNMKFDVIIGNPPYQLNDGGAGASAIPIYHKFVQQAMKMNPRYLVMIIPSRWFAGGKGLDNFRKEMINDPRIKVIKDFINSKECFPGVSIGGGVCYFLWDREFEGLCSVTNSINGNEQTSIRKLNDYPIFVRYNNAISIIKKIDRFGEHNISGIVSYRNPFGLSSSERGDNNIRKCYYLYSSNGVSKISKSKVTQGITYVNKYKVLISKVTSEHAGEPDKNGQFKIISTIRVLEPDSVCTDSYLIIGEYKSKQNAENLFNYLRTRFVRFLLLIAVTSINLSKEKFVFVPMQDFREKWTDEKLYKKYDLTKKEIEFIESMIKPMEVDNEE